MLKRFFCAIFLFLFLLSGYFYVKVFAGNSNYEISNDYFSIVMPAKAEGIYSAEKTGNGIFVSEKNSKESGEGGLAFGFKIFKNPQDYAGTDGYKKIGELKDKTGILYDMVLIRPDMVRYGEGEKTAENYDKLYSIADDIEIKGVNGHIYNKNQGMKGKDLYDDILKKYKNIFDENWTTVEQYQYARVNTAYYYFFKPNEKLSDKIGYVYYDINSDGIDELIIGRISGGKLKGIIYDIYTMVNRKPQLVLSGDNINKYFICADNFICNENSSDKNKNRLIVFGLDSNSTRLYPKIIFTYDANANKKEPWFISYNFTGKKENVSAKTYKERKNIYKYNRFDLIPFKHIN